MPVILLIFVIVVAKKGSKFTSRRLKVELIISSGMDLEIASKIASKCRHCRKLLENYSKTTSGVNLEIAKNSGMGFKAKGEAGSRSLDFPSRDALLFITRYVRIDALFFVHVDLFGTCGKIMLQTIPSGLRLPPTLCLCLCAQASTGTAPVGVLDTSRRS